MRCVGSAQLLSESGQTPGGSCRGGAHPGVNMKMNHRLSQIARLSHASCCTRKLDPPAAFQSNAVINGLSCHSSLSSSTSAAHTPASRCLIPDTVQMSC
ncbi:hypothetical protein NQZ68_027537 [Dissostichus eleginoides]|nr:hypothetical protein NQZ68_027537 [Dissostichus eleginoides]